MSTPPVALVVGVTGVTGTPMAEQLLTQGWKVYGLARRSPKLKPGTPLERLVHLRTDLQDVPSAHAALGQCSDITHVFYCANDGSSEVRLQMMTTLLDVLDAAPHFSNINLLQGMKYYGSNLGPFKTPAKETDPRISANEFYYREEDLVMQRQRDKRWTWTALRPHAVCGYAAGNPMNLATVLAIYGSILRETGRPFTFPGSEACFTSLFQLLDAELLARAAIHVSTSPGCGNQAYNINNGDIFRWKHVWPGLAGFFGLEPGGAGNNALSEFLTENRAAWSMLVDRHGLMTFPFDQTPQWVRGDYSGRNSRLACEHDIIADTLRLRQAGFTEVMDSQTMFVKIFERLTNERVIP